LVWDLQYFSTAVVLSVKGPALSGYSAWSAGITNNLTNYLDSATGDGFPNLLKYATGSSPTNSDNLARLTPLLLGGAMGLRFNRNTNATDVIFWVEGCEAATNDSAWMGIATNVGGVWSPSQPESGTGTPVSVSIVDPVTATTRFLRLRITKP
jgi:hypothetical protein